MLQLAQPSQYSGISVLSHKTSSYTTLHALWAIKTNQFHHAFPFPLKKIASFFDDNRLLNSYYSRERKSFFTKGKSFPAASHMMAGTTIILSQPEQQYCFSFFHPVEQGCGYRKSWQALGSGIYILQKIRNYAKTKIQSGVVSITDTT